MGTTLLKVLETKMTAHVIGIFGSPGTGKTTRIGEEIRQRVPSIYDPSQVICTSFTRAAAVALAGPDTLLDPEMSIRTMHSFGYRMFGETPPDVLGASRRMSTKNDATDGWNDENPQWEIGRMSQTKTEGDKLLADTSRMRNLMLPLDAFDEGDWQRYSTEYNSRFFWKEWARFKNRHEVIDFTDMLSVPLEEGHGPPNGAKFGVFDEAQDFTPLQLALIRKWAEHMDEVIFALDDDQSIYPHLGADPAPLIHWPGMEKVHLEQSYRMPGAIHSYSQAFIEQLPDREPKPFKPRADGYPGCVEYRRELLARHPEGIVDVCKTVAGAGLDIMVLAANNYQLNGVTKALKESGVPFHNPYREANGAWNPIKNTVKKVALVQDQRNQWTVAHLQALQALVKSTDVFYNGAATLRYCKDQPSGLPLTDAVLEEHFLRPAEDCSTDWLIEHAQKNTLSGIHYAAAIREAGLDAFEPHVIPGTIHCSPGDEPVLTVNRGYVPISELDPRSDRVLSYNRKSTQLMNGTAHGAVPRNGYAITSKQRHDYDGPLLTITTDTTQTRVTPSHLVVARLADSFMEKWVVYLMRRGDWWRIGICVSAHRPYRAGGVAGRMASEQADGGWVLGVFERREDALFEEARVQAEYGIPGLTFEASQRGRALSSERLHEIYRDTAAAVAPRVRALLSAYGLDERWPLYTRARRNTDDVKRNMRDAFETRAANLLSGYMEVPVVPPSFINGERGKQKPIWTPALVSRAPFTGEVWSIDVERYHYYISGGIAVHNSVKGGECDVVILLPDLSYAQMESPKADLIRIFYVGMTRARSDLLLGGTSEAQAMELPLP